MKARFLVLAAMMLGLASCQTEPEGLNVNVGGEVDTFVTVTIPETETRAGYTNSAKGVFDNGVLGGDATMRYIFQVYYNGQESEAKPQVAYSDGQTVTFPVRLVPGRDYNFVVWADVVDGKDAGDKHYIVYNEATDRLDLSNISVNEDTWVAMDESRDAFTVTEVIANYNGQMGINLELKRALAKLRVVTTDMEALNNLHIAPTYATVAYSTNHYSTFNAVNGTCSDKNVNKSHSYFIESYNDHNGETSKVLFTDYFFANNQEEVVNFTLNVYDQQGRNGNAYTINDDYLIKSNPFNTPIPARRNYLTTISGNVLTDGNNIEITVNDAFENANNTTGAPYYQQAVTNGVELIKALLAGQEIIVLNNITVTAADYAEATRTGAAINPVINLNGFNITIENTNNEALVNLNGGALTVEGEGTITSTNGALVEGTTVVTGEATVAATVAVDENGESTVLSGLEALKHICANGGEFTFANDLEATDGNDATDDILIVSTTKPVVINGNGCTLTSTASRAINVSGATNVTIKNLNIVASGERAINVINESKKVTIENVTATAANYTVNVAASAPGAVVAIKNSTLNGLCTVNVASVGANVTVDGSTVNCNDNNTTAGESYAALCLNKAAVGAKIIATNSTINVTEGSDSTKGRNGAEDGEVTINGGVEGVVVTKAVITYPGSDYYYGFETIAEAVEFAENGDVITLIRNVELTESTTVPAGKTITLDLNGKTITGTDSSTGSFGLITNHGNLTVKNGTMTLVATNNRAWNSYSSVISNTVGGNLVVEDVTIEHLGGTDMAYGIDNLTNGKGTSAVATINEGAIVKSTYSAIRQFLNGVEATNELYVKAGSTLVSPNRSIFFQDPSANANTGKLVVEAGASVTGDIRLSVTEGSTEWPVEVSVAASALVNGSEVTYGYIPAGYEVVLENGVWVVKAYDVVAAGVLMKDGEYYVNSVAGLQWIEAQTDNYFAGKTIKLMNDIDCKGAEIKPIHFWEPESPTTFDGQEHTIENVTMNMQNTDNVALFNGTAKIKNLNVDKATIVGKGYVGAIGGTLYGSLDNCHVTNSTVTGNYWQVGGLVGQYDSGDMDNCSVLSTTITGPSAVGALAGIWNEDGNRTFKNCKVENCAINQNYSFGADYDTLYGVLSGCANVNNTTFTVDNCVVNNNTIMGVANETLVGEVATGSNLVVK